MTIFREYRAMLKNPAVEEWPDLLIFRPLAFLLVKLFVRLPITPNQISYLAMITGLAGALHLARGDQKGFLIGAVFVALSAVIDCADGMVARLKKNGTPTGRIVDGFVDYVVSIAAYLGLGFGLSKAVGQQWLDLPHPAWFLVIAAGLSYMLHSLAADGYKKLYEEYVDGAKMTPRKEIEKYRGELDKMKGMPPRRFDKFLIRCYIRYLKLQISKYRTEPPDVPPEVYKSHNLRLISLWNVIGPSVHILFFVIAAATYRPRIFFFYTIVFANLWVLILLPIQIYVNRTMFRKFETTESA